MRDCVVAQLLLTLADARSMALRQIGEATDSEATRKLRGRSELWRNIERDGIVVHGRALDELVD